MWNQCSAEERSDARPDKAIAYTSRMGLRDLIRRYSRGRVLRRTLPASLGGAAVFVTPESALKLWSTDIERADPALFASARELVRPGEVVWDVGGNVGLFAFAAAYLAGPQGRVVVLEPDVFLASLLQRTASALPEGYARVQILSAAVSDQEGLAMLNIAEGGRASNSLGTGKSQMGGIRYQQPTCAVTLDRLLDEFPAPNVLKIDVEDMEYQALRGAAKVLESTPKIHCEMSSPEAFELLREAGYRLFNADVKPSERVILQDFAHNTLALPL